VTTRGYIISSASRIVALHEMLDSVGIRHQFGGAIALAWYRKPRATTNVDVNLTIPPSAADPVLGSLFLVGATVSAANMESVAKDGQARLSWQDSYLDVFFATMDLHQEMARQARRVQFGPVEIPILAPEHLIVCKAVYDRPKDWLDIEEMLGWGTEVDGREILKWIGDIVGPFSERAARLELLLGMASSSPRQLGHRRPAP
jgi:hypothetical protein